MHLVGILKSLYYDARSDEHRIHLIPLEIRVYQSDDREAYSRLRYAALLFGIIPLPTFLWTCRLFRGI